MNKIISWIIFFVVLIGLILLTVFLSKGPTKIVPVINDTNETVCTNCTSPEVNETLNESEIAVNETEEEPIIPAEPEPVVDGIVRPTLEQYMSMRHFALTNNSKILESYAEQAQKRCLKEYNNNTYLASIGVIVTSKQEGNKTLYGREYICFFPGNSKHKSITNSDSGTDENGNTKDITPTCHYEDKEICVTQSICVTVCHKLKCHDETTCHTEQIQVCLSD